jgi:hypothetical protein
MFTPGRLRTVRYPAKFERILNRVSPVILAGLILFTIVNGLTLIPLSNGGGDLVSADIPKSLMLLHGQDPYAVQPWASPYPPLLLLVDGGIIRLSTLFTIAPTVSIISQDVRMAGLVADAVVALTIYLYLRKNTSNPAIPLVSAGLFLTLPALSVSPLYFFHSDVFGYPILAMSIVALAANRYLIGTSLLATAAVFKIHPLLAIPLVLVWLARTRGARILALSLASVASILGLGLVAPLALPGYAGSILGFNLSNQGSGTNLSTVLALTNNIVPQGLQIAPTPLLVNQAWIASTVALFTIVAAVVWSKAGSLSGIDVVLLGLLVWLVPLKIEYTHYVAWAIIPILMRGQIKLTIPVLGMLQVADTLSYWSWWPSTSPFPGVNPADGLALAGILYRALGLAALGAVLFSLRNRSPLLVPVQVEPTQRMVGVPKEESPLFVQR